MTAVTITPARPRPATGVPVAWLSLVRVESWRVARHPAFLAGMAGVVVLYAVLLGDDPANPDRLTPGIAAIFIGVVGMVVMSLRSRAMLRSSDVVGSTPMSATARTAALCAACLVPFAAGLAVWAFHLWSLARWPLPRWEYGAFSDADQAVIAFGAIALSSLGGPLLGVAAGRWLRFPGATLLLTVAVCLWVTVVGQPSLFAGHVPTWATALRLSAPFAFFQTLSSSPRAMDSFPGSPWWYAGWQLGLCALAVLAALLRDSEGRTRRRLVVAGWVCLAVALAAWVLAFTGGLPDWLRTFPDGSTQWGADGVS